MLSLARDGTKPPSGVSFPLLALFVILAGAIAGVAYRYYQAQNEAIEQEVRNQLLTIAGLKVTELSEWRSRHIAEARALMADSATLTVMKRLTSPAPRPSERLQMKKWMEVLCYRLRFASATLADHQGRPILTVGRVFGNNHHLQQLAVEVVRQNDIVIRDFHMEDGTAIHLGMNLPLREDPGSTPFGVLLLGIDPADELYPLLMRWPVPNRTAETLLIRRDGDEVVFLNDLRHRPNAALRLRFPVTRTDMPAVQGVLGAEGAVTGIDYRGEPVLAVVRRVPDTPWYLVAKVDEQEVHAPIQRRAWLLIAATLSLILSAGFGIFILWRRQQLRFYRERFQAEAERQALIGHYDYLTRFANDIILLIDETGRIVEANDRAATTYGHSREELLSFTVRDLRHATAVETYQGDWEQATRLGSLVFETVHRSHDGSPFPVEVSVRAIDVDGKRFRQSIVRDITERKALDERLRRMLDTFSAVIEASPAAILSVTPDFRVTTWNKAAERMFGWTAEEVIGKPTPVIPDDQRAQADALQEQVMRGEVVTAARTEAVRKDGRRIAISLSAAPLHDHEGGIAGVALNILDITEQRQAEEATLRNEQRFRQVVEGAPAGILVERDLRILYVNSSAVKMLGASAPAELVGKFIPDMLVPEEWESARQRSATVARGLPVPPLERTFLRLDGQRVPVELSATPIEYDEQPAALVFLRDITERKQTEAEKSRLEEQLRHAQKMESLGRLAGGVAHDFNNHLTIIAGYCDMLLSSTDRASSAYSEIEEIRAAGERAAALTQQLLAFSRKQVADHQPVNLNEVVADAGKMIRRLIGEHVEVVTNLAAGLGLVRTDRGQMNQILMNLAINARDAMPSGGRIVIETANVTVDEGTRGLHKDAQAGPHVVFSLSDSGVGMSEETLQHIFEPFFTTKGLGIGTGLGLSTVYGIVQQNHGWIEVSTQPGQGSTFHIFLPRLAPQVTEALPAAETTPALRGVETILVVEDQAEVRRLATRILKQNGYQLLEASNGPEALAVSRDYPGPIHLLLTDVVMPGMSGRELATRLMELRPQMKVLYVSGYTGDIFGPAGQLDPDFSCLAKPFTPAALAFKIREVLG